MAFHIRNEETDALARRLARLRGVGLTEAVHDALRRELGRLEEEPAASELAVRFCRALRARADPRQGRPVDKRFYDELSGP